MRVRIELDARDRAILDLRQQVIDPVEVTVRRAMSNMQTEEMFHIGPLVAEVVRTERLRT